MATAARAAGAVSGSTQAAPSSADSGSAGAAGADAADVMRQEPAQGGPQAAQSEASAVPMSLTIASFTDTEGGGPGRVSHRGPGRPCA